MRNRYIRGLLPFWVVLLCAGCAGQKTKEYYSIKGFALGTSYSMIFETADTTGIQRSVDSLFRTVDNSMSVYNPGSLLNRLNRNETDSVDRYITHCIETAAKVSALTDGAYDITVKPLTQAWGFTGENAQYRPNVDSLLQFVDYRKIRVENGRLIKQRPEIQIDLNSVAKGYIVDLLGEMFASRGYRNYLVEVGGEIVCKGKNRRGDNWVTGIDKPVDGNNIPGQSFQVKLSFTDMGLATSGNYRKFYIDPDGNKVVHTINARTGESRPSNLLSATVIAENCALADALGTAFMVVGLDKSIGLLEAYPQYLGYLVYAGTDKEYDTYISAGLRKMIVE